MTRRECDAFELGLMMTRRIAGVGLILAAAALLEVVAGFVDELDGDHWLAEQALLCESLERGHECVDGAPMIPRTVER